MINITHGSHAHKLLAILSVAGEFSTNSVHLLGNERVQKALIANLATQQAIKFDDSKLECRVLTLSGEYANKSVRLCKYAFPLMEWIEAGEYYAKYFRDKKFASHTKNRERNFRIAECLMMFLMSGIEFRPYVLPTLQRDGIKKIVPNDAVFYPAREVKALCESELNKTRFTRMAGLLFSNAEAYAVYNTGDYAMKWLCRGETKARNDLLNIARMNAQIKILDTAILFCADDGVALKTLHEMKRNTRLELRFDAVYKHIIYIPLNQHGQRQLKFLKISNWHERILKALFDDSVRSFNMGDFEYDAKVNDFYILSFLDGDIAKLYRFAQVVKEDRLKAEIVCFSHQKNLIEKYLGSLVRIKQLSFEKIENIIIIKE